MSFIENLKTKLKRNVSSFWGREPKPISRISQILMITFPFLLIILPSLISFLWGSMATEMHPYGTLESNIMASDYEIVYSVDSFTSDSEDLILTTEVDEDRLETNVELEFNNTSTNFLCDTRSAFLKGTKQYTMFFVMKENSMDFNEEYDIIDHLGLLGVVDKEYTMEIKESVIYWNEEPKLKGLLFAKTIQIKDEDTLIAEGLISSKSGLILRLEYGDTSLTLTDPDDLPLYFIRNEAIYIGLGLLIGIPLVIYLFSKRKEVDNIEVFSLSLIGTLSIFADFILDPFLYAVFSEIQFIILHGVFIGVIAIILFISKNKMKWVFPLLLIYGMYFLLKYTLGVSFFLFFGLSFDSTLLFVALILQKDVKEF